MFHVCSVFLSFFFFFFFFLTHKQEFPFSPWCVSIINVLHTAVWFYSSGNVQVISAAHGGLIPILRHSEELKPPMAWNANANVLKVLMMRCVAGPQRLQKNMQLISYSLKHWQQNIITKILEQRQNSWFYCLLDLILFILISVEPQAARL